MHDNRAHISLQGLASASWICRSQSRNCESVVHNLNFLAGTEISLTARFTFSPAIFQKIDGVIRTEPARKGGASCGNSDGRLFGHPGVYLTSFNGVCATWRWQRTCVLRTVVIHAAEIGTARCAAALWKCRRPHRTVCTQKCSRWSW